MLDKDFVMKLETTYLLLKRNKDKYLREYAKLHALQGGLCAVCGRPLLPHDEWPVIGAASKDVPRGVIDHCHKSGAVRGLLSTRCNTIVGYVEHGLLLSARRYLDGFPSFTSRTD